MGQIILGGDSKPTAVKKGTSFDLYVRVVGASPKKANLELKQTTPPAPVAWKTDVTVFADGTGSDYFRNVTLDTLGYVTLTATDAAKKLLSDAITVLVNP